MDQILRRKLCEYCIHVIINADDCLHSYILGNFYISQQKTCWLTVNLNSFSSLTIGPNLLTISSQSSTLKNDITVDCTVFSVFILSASVFKSFNNNSPEEI